MKKNNYVLTFILIILLSLQIMAGDKEPLTFAVMSDPHLMAPSLVVNSGTAFDNYVVKDRKLLKESNAITDKAVSEILKKKPSFVLVCGDLTKDGEEISHRMLAEKYFSKYRKAGIKVYVVPGNHDINNPHAVSFDRDKTIRVPSVSPEEFAEIYKDYGYKDALARDTASLSYSAQLTDSIVLIAIDDCKYYENDFEKNSCVTSGVIKPATLEFIKREAEKAHAKGFQVMAMMHHGLVEHWKWQSKAMRQYLTDDWKKQVKFFAKNDINIIFTGHFHAQDIAEKRGVYDIETGSTVTYPCPYRIISIEGDSLKINSFFVSNIDYPVPSGKDFTSYAHDFLEEAMPGIIKGMFSDKVPEPCKTNASKIVSRAYVANLAGDEKYLFQDKEEIKAMKKEVRQYSWKQAYIFSRVAKYLWNDKSPADNDAVIRFKK